MVLFYYDRDLMEILDVIISKLKIQNLKRYEVNELCGSSNYHIKAIEILEKEGLIKLFGEADNNEYPNYLELRKTEKLDLFLKGENSFTKEYLIEKKQRSLEKINTIINELVVSYGYDIPYKAINEKARNDDELFVFLLNEIQERGYNIIGNTIQASSILADELENIDEVPYSEIISYSKKLKISELEFVEIATKYLNFINIRPGEMVLLQKKGLNVDGLYDKLDELTNRKNNRESKTLIDIANQIKNLTQEEFGNLLSYKQIDNVINELIRNKDLVSDLEKNLSDELISHENEELKNYSKLLTNTFFEDFLKKNNLPSKDQIKKSIKNLNTESDKEDYLRKLTSPFFEELRKGDYSYSDEVIKETLERIYNGVKNGKDESEILDVEDLEEFLNTTYYRFGHKSYSPIDRSIPPCFNITQITEVLADHLNNLGKEKGGQMVGIFGRWGRGKTYLVEELQKTIEKSPYLNQFIFIPFYAWKYQDTPAIWAYLYECLSEKYLGKNEFKKVQRKIYLNIYHEKWGLIKDLILISTIWSLISLLFKLVKIDSSGFIGDLINFFKSNWWQTIAGGTVFTSIIKFYKKNGQKAIDLLKKYSKEISFSKHLGVQAEVEKEMVNLLTTWIGKRNKKRIILFVDDIDRCSEDKIIQLVDALRVMLENEEITKRIIVLVAIDEDKLKMAIQYKYRQLLPNNKNDDTDLEKLETEYLDKLFISGIKLQPLSKKNINEFAEKLVIENWKDETTNFIKSKEQSHKIKPDDSSLDKSNEDTSTAESVTEISESASKPSTQKEEENKRSLVMAELNAKEEILLIQEALKEFKNELTPRQVRIFYYRFQLAKNLYIKLVESEGEEVITPDLKDILTAIRKKTEKLETETSDEGLINQIAEMVVGY
jgi:hypothetical protein